MIDASPDWLLGEMPAGYQTRVSEIHRLTAELHDMDRFGRLLWQVGAPLADAVRDLFVALKLDVEPLRDSSPAPIGVKLDGHRHLLLHVSGTDGVIQKKSDDLAQTFQLLHEFAGDEDRVVLVANTTPALRPAEREAPMTPDAVDLLRRLGANFVSGPTLFAIWTLFLQDPKRGRTILDRLHAQEGGIFLPPSA